MRHFVFIALKHILARKRQSFVSLLGIVIGVAFFLAISALMQGSQNDFIARLIDNSPHITIYDEFREAEKQPVEEMFPDTVIELRSLKPQTESRGIRGYRQIVDYLKSLDGVKASASLTGQAIFSFAGRDVNISLNGMIPQDMRDITTIDDNMVEGSLEALIANRNGIVVGAELMRRQSLSLGDNITLSASSGQVKTYKIVGVFRTGRADYDKSQAFLDIKRVQALMNRSNRANAIIVKMERPERAREVAALIESRIRYKSVSWQESSEDLMSTLAIRNMIMYSVVSAVLIVAAFGIYNIISTIVMEKHRDIAILKSMGYRSRDIKFIFLVQGVLLGACGVLLGLPVGCLLMYGLMQITFNPPGATEPIHMPVDWGVEQFLIAGAFAFFAALFASYLPARKAADVLPIDILRGGQ
ncbi:MAG: ABC transporter permease [Micavibrio aeruginosavorus]|uniref:ABC transporter permease n=1 Tax=Micavibrio aeruginosavorus TaxID=349221 RepID=A0A7T5R401_9BACT|nr:MAG: ABC transporter permease [Micavibrio aeruginosavorus]